MTIVFGGILEGEVYARMEGDRLEDIEECNLRK